MSGQQHEQRVESLQQLMSENRVDCVALMPGANLLYFTGINTHLSERPTTVFVPSTGSLAAVLPHLEAPAARDHLPGDARLFTYRDEEGHEAAFHQLAAALELPGKPIGIEYLAMRVLEMRRIEQAAPGCSLLAVEPWLPALRMHKDETEIEHMRRAVSIAERAMHTLLDAGAVRAGRSELEVAADLKIALLREGSQGDAFSPIVVAGPNSASPHASPSDRPMADGEFVVIDWGAVYRGYRSDITRTFALGTPTPEMERIYEAVLAANQAGELAARPNTTAQEVDRAARQSIILAGYGEHFIHRTGHGLGLETHEPPYIVEGNQELLKPGMTFTIEPGIYVPGVGGVRIEDDMVVGETAAESLTTIDRKLVCL